MKTPQQDIISNWLEKNGDPAISKLVENNLAIATKIQSILDQKGLKNVDLAKMLNKQPSEISKWLTGTHTFTTKTISKIEVALQEKILFVEPQVQYVKFKLSVNKEIDEQLELEPSHIFSKNSNYRQIS